MDFEKLKEALSSKTTTSNYLKLKDNQKRTIRILPDRENNMPFYKHYMHYNIAGKHFPCLKTWGEECPVCQAASNMYKYKYKEAAVKNPKYKALFSKMFGKEYYATPIVELLKYGHIQNMY